jgi:hypothetical protein
MLFCFAFLASSFRVETEFAVKFSAACPVSPESYLIVDNGVQAVKPPLYGKTYVWLEPGIHLIDVSHPWCTFFSVHLSLKSDGTFTAVSNSSSTGEFPIAIRHMANTDSDILTSFMSSKWMLLMILVPIVMQFLKKYLSSPEVQEKLRKLQEDAQKQVDQERQKGK